MTKFYSLADSGAVQIPFSLGDGLFEIMVLSARAGGTSCRPTKLLYQPEDSNRGWVDDIELTSGYSSGVNPIYLSASRFVYGPCKIVAEFDTDDVITCKAAITYRRVYINR
jgi:hypothetical protein